MPPIEAARKRPPGRGSRYCSAASANRLRVTDMERFVPRHDTVRIDAQARLHDSRSTGETGVEHRAEDFALGVERLGTALQRQRPSAEFEPHVLGSWPGSVGAFAPDDDGDDALVGELQHRRRQPALRRGARHEPDRKESGGPRIRVRTRAAQFGLPQPRDDEGSDGDRGDQRGDQRDQRQQGGTESDAGCREPIGPVAASAIECDTSCSAGPSPLLMTGDYTGRRAAATNSAMTEPARVRERRRRR